MLNRPGIREDSGWAVDQGEGHSFACGLATPEEVIHTPGCAGQWVTERVFGTRGERRIPRYDRSVAEVRIRCGLTYSKEHGTWPLTVGWPFAMMSIDGDLSTFRTA
jgi:hypothetical protein